MVVSLHFGSRPAQKSPVNMNRYRRMEIIPNYFQSNSEKGQSFSVCVELVSSWEISVVREAHFLFDI